MSTAVTIPIDDPADSRLADYRLLADHTARRRLEADDFFVAEGFLAVERLLDSGHQMRSALVLPSRVDRVRAMLADRTDAPIYVVSRAVMAGTVGFDLHRGVLAAAQRRPLRSLASVIAESTTLAVLSGLNDPENVGLLARSARAFGIDGLILDPTCIDPYNRRSVRVSLGEILHLQITRIADDDWPTALDELAASGFETWALTPDRDAVDLWSLARPDRVALVVGAEGPGLDPQVMQRATRQVRIPIACDVDSLNVSAAGAIAFAATTRGKLARD